MNVNEHESKNKKEDFNESYKANYQLQFFYIGLRHYNWEPSP